MRKSAGPGKVVLRLADGTATTITPATAARGGMVILRLGHPEIVCGEDRIELGALTELPHPRVIRVSVSIEPNTGELLSIRYTDAGF